MERDHFPGVKTERVWAMSQLDKKINKQKKSQYFRKIVGLLRPKKNAKFIGL